MIFLYSYSQYNSFSYLGQPQKLLYLILIFLGNFHPLVPSESSKQTTPKENQDEFERFKEIQWDTQNIDIRSSSSSSTPIEANASTPSQRLSLCSDTDQNIAKLEKFLKKTLYYQNIIESIQSSFNDIRTKYSDFKEKFNNYKNEDIRDFLNPYSFLNQKNLSLRKQIKAFFDKIKQAFRKIDINLKEELLWKALPELTSYTNKFSKITEQLERDFNTIRNIKTCFDHKDKDLEFFLNHQTLIPGYEFLEKLEFISDDSIKNIIQQTKQNSNNQLTTLCNLYINLAHGLYHAIEKDNIIALLKKVPNIEFDSKSYPIAKWNLFHVFLGSMWKDGFAGVHSKTITPDIFSKSSQATNQDDGYNERKVSFYKLVPYASDNQVEAGFIFYKTNQLTTLPSRGSNYYIKTSSFFPKQMSLKDCIESVLRALLNIKLDDTKGDIHNFIGVDEEKSLAINIQYDAAKKTITTFYPMFNVNKNETVDQIREKYTRYSNNSFQQTISERAYNEFMQFVQKLADEEKTFQKLNTRINNLAQENPLPATPTPKGSPKKPGSGGGDDDDSGAFPYDGQSPTPTRTDSIAKLDRSEGSLTPLFRDRSPSIPSVLSTSVLDQPESSVARATAEPKTPAKRYINPKLSFQSNSRAQLTPSDGAAAAAVATAEPGSTFQSSASDARAQSSPPDEGEDPFKLLEEAFEKLIALYQGESSGATPAAVAGQADDAQGSRSGNTSSGTNLDDDESMIRRTPEIPRLPLFIPESSGAAPAAAVAYGGPSK